MWMRDSQLPKRYFQDFPLHDHHSLFDSPELPETRLMPKYVLMLHEKYYIVYFLMAGDLGGTRKVRGGEWRIRFAPKMLEITKS